MANARHVVIFTARKVVCAALAIYVVGITLLALLPIATISTTELIIAGACGVALVWLFGRAFESVVIPGERFAYLLTGFLGLISMLAYDFGATEELSRHKWWTSFFLAAGIIGAYGAHIAQGPEKNADGML